MISAFFTTWSIWFTFLLLGMFFMVTRKKRKKPFKVADLFLFSLVHSFLFTIPSFWGFYKLLGS